MQKNLNQQDNDTRNLNIIISGMREDEIEIVNGNDASTTLKSDHEKVTWLLKYLKSEHFTDQMIAEFSIQRLGKKREGFNRIVKIKLKSVKDRDAFLVNAPTLKNAPVAWGKVFIKKDQHPVYLAEDKRLRKKVYDLKQLEENVDKEIKLPNGKILFDGVIIDKKSFYQ